MVWKPLLPARRVPHERPLLDAHATELLVPSDPNQALLRAWAPRPARGRVRAAAKRSAGGRAVPPTTPNDRAESPGMRPCPTSAPRAHVRDAGEPLPRHAEVSRR